MSRHMEIAKRKRDFNLEDGIAFPEKITYHKVENTHLFIAPEKASYICANDIGKRILQEFQNGLCINEVIEELSKEYNNEIVISELRKFLIMVDKQGFYEDIIAHEEDEELPVLQLYLTNDCNLKCKHCYMDAGRRKNNELNLREWLNVVNNWADCFPGSRIVFTGGEPLLKKGFINLLSQAKERMLTVELFSNGTLIDEETAKMLSQVVDIVQLSLDGASPDINDRVRGKGVYEKVVKAIRFLEPYDIKLRIAVVLMPQNAQDFKDNIEGFASSFKKNIELKFGFATTEGRAVQRFRFATDAAGEAALQEILRILYKKKLKRMRKVEPNVIMKNCGYGMSVAVSSDGFIYPCAIMRNSYGNIKEHHMKDVFDRIYSDRLKSNIDNFELCDQCDVRFFCYGGCRLNNLTYHKTLFTPYCPPGKKEDMYRVLVNRMKFDPVAIWLGDE